MKRSLSAAALLLLSVLPLPAEAPKVDVSFEEKLLATAPHGTVLYVTFARDGRHVAYYSARGGQDSSLALDDKTVVPLGHVNSLTLSPDGQTLAYAASTHENEVYKQFVVVGDAKGEEFAQITSEPVFSPDGKQVAYAVRTMDSEFIVVGGKKGEECYQAAFPVFSPDGQTLAYAESTKADHAWCVVVGDKKGDSFNDVGAPAFSPDGKTVAYPARKGSKWFLVVNDKRGEECDEILGDLVFNAGGECLYLVQTGKRGCVVARRVVEYDHMYPWVDEHQLVHRPAVFGGEDDWVIAYPASNGGNWFLVVKGNPAYGHSDTMSERVDEVSTPVFSPDGKMVAYGARKGRELWWKVMQVK